MINQKNVALGKVRSSIRELYEYGKARKAEIGEENVFDFSLGNPSVPAPEEVNAAIKDLVDSCNPVTLHGYTSAPGDYDVRNVIALDLNKRFNVNLNANCIYLTCGAAASLTITLNALVNRGDEVVALVPYFPEYKVFAENAGAKFVTADCEKGTFQIDLQKLESALSPATKAVIINSPNNPSGVVYSRKSMILLGQLLEKYSKRYKNRIYLISDEPYRELVYEKHDTSPYITDFYAYSVVCYSYSKSLSLPGERIGYIAVNNNMPDYEELYAGICGAGRALGFVCAPNLFQQVIKRVCNKTADINIYKQNKDLLYNALVEYGYEVVKPQGAFYMFVKSLEPDAKSFAERAKKYELLFVPGDDFGCKSYVRIAYCVAPQTINNALPQFKALAESYK